jgi:hypothetical protein
MPIVLNGTTGITTPTYNGSTTAEYLVPVTGFKNRLINGDMTIDQRNAGAAISVSGSYPVDRFYVIEGATSATFTSQRSTTAPAGFTNSLLFTVGTGASAGASEQVQIRQAIEGFNIADLGWGTANAKAVTLSFQVRASVTGTYCVFLQDTNATLSYVATYTISAANTWETKSVTIAGPTTGTFDTTNSTGVMIGWDLGSGSNFNATAGAWQSAVSARRTTGQTNFISNSGATFFLTGVQFEVGSNATSFDYLPYGTELALCQRYFEKSYSINVAVGTNTDIGRYEQPNSLNFSTNAYGSNTVFQVSKRANPTITGYTYSGTVGLWHTGTFGATEATGTFVANKISTSGFSPQCSFSSTPNVMYGHWTASSEL